MLQIRIPISYPDSSSRITLEEMPRLALRRKGFPNFVQILYYEICSTFISIEQSVNYIPLAFSASSSISGIVLRTRKRDDRNFIYERLRNPQCYGAEIIRENRPCSSFVCQHRIILTIILRSFIDYEELIYAQNYILYTSTPMVYFFMVQVQLVFDENAIKLDVADSEVTIL